MGGSEGRKASELGSASNSRRRRRRRMKTAGRNTPQGNAQSHHESQRAESHREEREREERRGVKGGEE
jgi:hypothetical protein